MKKENTPSSALTQAAPTGQWGDIPTQGAPTGYMGDGVHHAWSDPTADIAEDYPYTGALQQHHSWWHVTGWFTAAVALVVATISIAVIATRPHTTSDVQGQRVTAPVQDAPQPTTTVLVPPIPPATVDEEFVDMVENGLAPKAHLEGTEKTIELGHWVCGYLAKGHTIMDAIDDLVAKEKFISGNPFTPEAARVITDASVQMYCPQFGVPA